MSARTIPPLLTPYVALPPEASLILLTSVLGASTNWLVLRYLQSYLQSPSDDVKVVLVSFMRDLRFWKENGRKMGIDLPKLTTQNRFHFLDGLSSLYLPSTPPPNLPGQTTLTTPSLPQITAQIQSVLTSLSANSKTILILDAPDILLATSPTISPTDLSSALLNLRSSQSSPLHATILTLSADAPFLAPSTGKTSLEINAANFLLSTAHTADLILALRMLDTGTAKDVSGVLRASIGGAMNDDEGAEWEEKELLYFVGGDGGVKVFERGQ